MVQSYRKRPNETYMCERQLAYFRDRLMQWRQSLLESAQSYRQYMNENHVTYADDIDAASQTFTEQIDLKSKDRERKLIAKIQKTLQDMQLGDYGYCQDCGNEIGLKRLEARPTATRCFDCKTVAEAVEKRVGKSVKVPELV